ncbi:TIGR03086 family metal-binding protein [Ammonicoccus fulvus]|uniref:TIGR03086 family metal-binding protein n=1 Tax=Ammonicoccus fulvus TaxID=3138240 RepID=A0ABZ3FWC4_9ACTN
MSDRIDPRLPLTAALDQAGALITTTAPEDASRPTPCDEFDVGALIGHLVAIPTRIAVIARGEDAWAVPSTLELEPEAWTARWAEARAAVDAALAPDEVLQREFRAPFGTVPAPIALGMYVTEFLIHAWDLARATGRDDQIDRALADRIATTALPQIRQAIPAEGRDEIPFGPVVEVDDSASPFDQLLGWYGRDPRPVHAQA